MMARHVERPPDFGTLLTDVTPQRLGEVIRAGQLIRGRVGYGLRGRRRVNQRAGGAKTATVVLRGPPS